MTRAEFEQLLDERFRHVLQWQERALEARQALERAESPEDRLKVEAAVRAADITLAGAKDLFFDELYDVVVIMQAERQREAAPEVARA